MGMVVRTNVNAMNANRSLGKNTTNVGKSLEKLSSGFRINRAADDASGLAISEKMKAQIKGLEQASSNSQDGISLIQTAEGATQEIHNMLNRMTELATKSANGTSVDEVDREAIQKEVDDLKTEISRISESTNFNGIKLLDGNLSSTGSASAAGVPSISGGTLEDVAAVAYVDNSTALTDTTLAATEKLSYTVNYTDADGNDKSATVELTVKTAGVDGTTAGVLTAADGTEYTESDTVGAGFKAAELAGVVADELMKDKDFAATFKVEADTADLKFTAKTAGADTKVNTLVQDSNGTVTLNAMDGTGAGADSYQKMTGVKQGDVFEVDGTKFAAFEDAAAAQAAKDALTGDDVGKYDDVNMIYTATAGTGDIAIADSAEISAAVKLATGYDGLSVEGAAGELHFKAATDAASSNSAGGGLDIQVGDTNDSFNHVTVSVDDLTSKGLGIDNLDVSNQNAAGESIQTIKDAINTVSTNRANLGSLQNRLEYTINNLDTTAENMTAANSRIRDTDMAKEMMNYSKNNILTQAAQAMLAQANQQPQAILQLLQ